MRQRLDEAGIIKRPADRDLVERSRKGDPEAFRAIFERYKRRAYALALGVVHDKDAALDVVQESFLRAHRHLDGFEGNASVYTWLYRIVMNASIDHLRKHGNPLDDRFCGKCEALSAQCEVQTR